MTGQRYTFSLVVLSLAFFLTAAEQLDEMSRSWNRPVAPARIIGGVYYVGAAEVASYLITTPQGHILLDSGFEETVPIIQKSIARLGFKLEDVRILLNSHAHFDHAAGLARLKELTGASLQVSEADAVQIENGGKNDFAWGDRLAFPPASVDRKLRDGDTVSLGGVTLTARLTPGHTKGCTTWTMTVKEADRNYDVVFACSISALGYRLVDNPKYRNIVHDYEKTLRTLKALPCDVFLAAHGSFFGLLEKLERARKSEKANPFVDPQGYRDYLEQSERSFREKLENQRKKKGEGLGR
ncbi:MAG: subclass B3 metallo-beta-lactamase [Candidatus Acidiferrales bacterium]